MSQRPSVRPQPCGKGALTLPLWRPLGVQRHKWGNRYWLEIGDGWTVGLRAHQLRGICFLADVYPDLKYWHRMFPRGMGGYKIDVGDAMAYFIRACEKAGEYVPPKPAADERESRDAHAKRTPSSP